jgi:hypothetical protein
MKLLLASLLLASLVLAAAVAQAQIDCSDPDNLCTGDPCTIASSIEVTPPCVVDFGSRALVVTGTVHAPSNSLVSFTAGSIMVSGVIEATDPTFAFHVGGDIVLTATGDVTVSGRLNVYAPVGGTITLDAGGNVRIRGPVNASGTFGGGGVAIDAGADVEITRPVKVRGGAGTIAVTAGGNLVVDGSLLAQNRANGGGPGGNVTLLAGGTVLVRNPIRAASMNGCGANVVVRGALGVAVERRIDARATCDVDVEVSSSGGDVTIANRIDAGAPIGTIRLEAAGTLSVAGSLSARGGTHPGGTVFVRGATVSLATNVDVRGEPGGTIEGTATGDLTASGLFRAVPNGCIALSAGGTLDTSGATLAPPPVPDCPGSPSGAFLD